MPGQRIRNDQSFECEPLKGKKIEYFSFFYSDESLRDVLMVLLKLQEIESYQRFFLDATLGFWEKWDYENTFLDIDDLKTTDLCDKYNLKGLVVSRISCKGSHE
ncbi:hypothetical protein [Desulfogranum japonicum]|uniref:hypothetical protein n=1 Tax=Desulfogranum japonicum TaxID=231447 RepID=UPI00040CCB1A|nr:hypothetical protein [Desulfogranum japonicum]